MRRYVRLKSDPLVILKSGYVGPGGLGAFDETLFEEVEGELPQGWQNYQPPAPLDQRIAAAFGQLPAEMQAKYADEVTKAAIFYQWQNLTMLSVVIAQAEAKLSLPDEQAVKDILDAAKAELGG